jgi:hypothetical protein
MPSDAITGHAATAGASVPYGVAIVFAVACAGRVEYVPPPPGNGSPDALPLGCFDASGARLGADDFVFAYATVYAFTDRTNSNPVLQSLTLGGKPLDPSVPFPVERCTKSKIDDCPTQPLGVSVPASSQEADPATLDADGHPLKEEIYVDYYVTAGKVKNDVTVLFDPRAGALSGTDDDFFLPQAAGDAHVWAVVHDNRGGVSWKDATLHVQ